MSGAGGPATGRGVTGVCHMTATAQADTHVDHLVVRLVMTLDVESAVSITRHALGPDQACAELRLWMETMCESPL